MKTSNILILVAIAGVFIYVSISIFAGKSAIKDKLANGNEVTLSNQQSKNLESFTVLKINDGSVVNAISSEHNTLFYHDDFDIENNVLLKNDTLIIGGKEVLVTLNLNKIQSIIITENASATLTGLNTDSLSVYLFNNTQLIAENLDINSLQLYANDNSNFRIIRSQAHDVYLQAEEFSNIELFCKMKKISGTTSPDTRLVMTAVKNISLQANGSLSMMNEQY